MVTKDAQTNPSHPGDLETGRQRDNEVCPEDALPSGSRQRLTSRQRREQLLDVAGEVIRESGLGGITMERVARRAGVSKGIMYRHFANADDVIVELYRREVLDHRVEVRDALEGSPKRSSEAGFRAFFTRWTAEDRTLRHLLMHTTTVSGPLREVQEAFAIQSEEYFSRLYQNRLGISETSANIAATLVLGALKGSIRSWERGHGTDADIERVFVAMIDGGLRTLVDREARWQNGGSDTASPRRSKKSRTS